MIYSVVDQTVTLKPNLEDQVLGGRGGDGGSVIWGVDENNHSTWPEVSGSTFLRNNALRMDASVSVHARITSYNVCYTKLLR